MVNASRLSEREIRDLLDRVPDPEIPVISVVDLGIVRDVRWRDRTCEITLTPTYTGCPATSVIEMEIERALRDGGVESLCLNRQLSPPWTTDWLSEKGRASLEAYGIAPPQGTGRPERCPQCGAGDLTLTSQFGSTPCKALWRCNACLEPFDYFKCI